MKLKLIIDLIHSQQTRFLLIKSTSFILGLPQCFKT